MRSGWDETFHRPSPVGTNSSITPRSSHQIDAKRYASLLKWTDGLSKMQSTIAAKAAQSGPGSQGQGGLMGLGSMFIDGGASRMDYELGF